MNDSLLENILPLAITLFLALLIPGVMMALSALLGPSGRGDTKLDPFECGIQQQSQRGDARHRFHVKFYLVAMFFLVFDVEILFLFPWAIWFQDRSLEGLLSMGFFVGVLLFGWFYIYKRGGLRWEE